VRTALALAAATVVFTVLATANSGGYRYGVSDQAFYVPAAVLALDADAYPLDAPLIRSQSRLLVTDELLAASSRWLNVELPPLFLAAYLVTVIVLVVGAVTFARACRFSWWATSALLLLMTFRHRIARTGANSLEGYMHPRMLAFALGLTALAALVRGRVLWSVVLVGLAAGAHPTTALWFGVVIFVGLIVARPRWRRALTAVSVVGAGVAVWTVLAGPLEGSLAVMDARWLGVLATKDYLFPTDWPPEAWMFNLAYPVVIGLLYRLRLALGEAQAGERALMAGLAALVVVFLVSVPLTAMHVALAVQLQVTRVFWLLDFVVAAYLAWWLVGGPRRRLAVVAVLALASAGRGAYILMVEQPERRLVQVDLAPGPWTDTMRWIGAQPSAWHVLADPDHGWKYGTSVRVAARRDTLVESGKDSAIALYDRTIALRVAERLEAVGVFADLTPARLQALASRFGLDVVVVESGVQLPLPELHRNDGFVVYALR